MSLIEIDCMAVYLGHIGRIDYWYRVEDKGDLKRVEFDSEVIQMCEMCLREFNLELECYSLGVILQELPEFDKAIVVYDRLDKVTSNEAHKTRKPTPSMNSATARGKEKVAAVDECSVQRVTNKATSKGKENVAEVDEGFVDAEINEIRRSVRKRNPSIQQEADDADDSSETGDENDPDFVDNEYSSDEDDDDEVFLHEVDIDDSSSFRKALKAISIKEGWEICWMKYEKYRIMAICATENCPFKIYRPVFQRMYICFGACKEGFKAGCKPVIGLDGCHLKSPYGGQLLSAIGLDGNNMTWVIAYAQLEMETKDSWIWFL
ncbi:hypothetical protein PRUPE_1G164500 [Prunus persica]|uniref:Transposase MuDR plant domain-containing protein n=1 Tax=Prunus persica TaxID=3760 RepID=A0A251QYC2_PRUPE|nr:hypothetical protein PRUPE_1G164500 [Prunus persica]